MRPANLFPRLTIAVLAAALLLPAAWSQAPETDAEQFSLAARRGDAAAVKALLEKGVDVNTKFRYDVTALFYACDRGYVEVVQLLLDRGAEVNLRDKFYNSTPLDWASSPASVEEPTEAHVEIVKLLLAKGAQGGEQVLLSAARSGNLAMAEAVLSRGGLKPETLTAALATATTGKHDAIVAALKTAGAVPPFAVDAAVLASYVGKYRADSGEIDVSVSEGKLVASPGGRPIPLFATDNVTFFPEGFGGISVHFQVEADKVKGFVLHQGGQKVSYSRVEEEKKP
jgi:hypothetical protein